MKISGDRIAGLSNACYLHIKGYQSEISEQHNMAGHWQESGSELPLALLSARNITLVNCKKDFKIQQTGK
ncbi:MAG TPA: hypothetical protein VE870_12205 [Bacteroidales bacterium]|nr:hypothetical protein [Bacteroidales bacterium]